MSYKKLIVVFLVVWLIWSGIQSMILFPLGFGWTITLSDAFISHLFLAATAYELSVALRFYQPEPKNAFYLIIWSIGLAIVCTLLIYVTLKAIHHQHLPYLRFLSDSVFIRFAFSWLFLSFMALFCWLWYYMQEQQEIKNRSQAAEKLVREAELSKLRQQLQPHFLFNSLNSISALIVAQPQQARKMVQQLSDFLRGTLKKDEQQLVTLEEELRHLQLYLDIEKVRFGHRLNTVVEQDEACRKMVLPALLLQPIVENAIKFGLYDTLGETTIRIKAMVAANHLLLITENPFDPATAQPRQGTGFGLRSVQRRLFLLFARHNLLSTEQKQQTFITQIKIPQPA